MAASARKSSKKRNQGRHRRRDTDRVVRWLQAGAVATGVGAAVISGQGTAWASTDSDAADSSDTSGASDTGAPGDQGGAPETKPSPKPESGESETDPASDELEAPDTEVPDLEIDDSDDSDDSTDDDDQPAVGPKPAKKSSSPRASSKTVLW